MLLIKELENFYKTILHKKIVRHSNMLSCNETNGLYFFL